MRLSVRVLLLMYEGKIQQCDTPANVKASLACNGWKFTCPQQQTKRDNPEAQRRFREVVSDVQRSGDRLDVLTQQPKHTRNRRILEQQKIQVQFAIDTPTQRTPLWLPAGN